MQDIVLKLNQDLTDYICKEWTKVRYGTKYGYAAELENEIIAFVDRYFNFTFIDTGAKSVEKVITKWLTELFDNGWIYVMGKDCDAPFGLEFENKLPFELEENEELVYLEDE